MGSRILLKLYDSNGKDLMKTLPVGGPNVEPNTDLQKQKLRKACEDFEAIMVTYLFKSMHETTLKADTEEFGSGRDLYEGMMDEAVASQLSHHQGLGLGKLLYQQLAHGLELKRVSDSAEGSVDLSSSSSEPIE